ncbi:MAG: uncharacterized protein QOD06_697 [Candidatus Binatota bacterium]|nr:uncharacterized protein [Candidatus Binatota bacterium]
MRSVRFAAAAGAAAIAAGLLALAVGGGIAVELLWFGELGFGGVYRRVLAARAITFAIATGVSFAALAITGLWALRNAPPPSPVRLILRRGNGDATIPELIAPVMHRIPWRLLVLAPAVIAAVLVGIAQAAAWDTYLLWWNAAPAGQTDPIFGRDVGFYLFSLPVYRSLFGFAMAVVVLAILLVAAVFWLRNAIDLRDVTRTLSPAVVGAVSLALAAFFVVKAGGHWLARYELLLDRDGAVFGVGYTGATVRLPLLWLSLLVSLGAAGACVANLRRRGLALPAGAVMAVVAVSIVTSVLPDLFHRFRVRPDELRLETPYLEHAIRLTRAAYGLESVAARAFPSAGSLDRAAIERNEETFDNVRLWDPRPLLSGYRQLQVIRLYYDFNDVDIDRYDVAGKRRQVMVAAREIDAAQLPEAARTWVNQRLKFTHGFGAVMSPVNEFDGEGLPVFFLKDIPPRSSVGLEITEPRIYYGEIASDPVVVKSASGEFDYPKGDQNVANVYAGTGGVPIGGWLRRMLFAWQLGDVNLLISGNVTAESRVMMRRTIRDRVRRVAPFLRLDRDPYLVVADGRLYWIQDAYTTSTTYPYSEPVPGLGLNYMRNSVKIVVDAYHGRVDLYAMDPEEPVLAAYARAFPGLFRSAREIPPAIAAHLRYPEDLFLVQAEMYRTYHMTEPSVFYNKEDLWSFPTETLEGAQSVVEPYYVNMKLPGGDRTEFILMQPMTPANRNNMVAWLAARCDPPHYGELVEYEFPKERLIYGPSQIEARIDQDTVISQQISLWNQMGSKVIRGNLLVIPVEDTLIYVQPLYLRSEQGQIPELKRVIVAHGDRIAMDRSFSTALAAVAVPPGGAPPPLPPIERPAGPAAGGQPRPPTMAEGTEARERYRAALDSLRRGDWVGFGREMEALGRSLEPPPVSPAAPAGSTGVPPSS